MSASAFDTLTAARDLESAGLDKRQAEAIVGAIRNGQGDLATKSDIVAVKSDIVAVRSEVASVKSDIDSVRSEVASVKSDIDSVRSELAVIRWVLGIQAAVTLATFAIVAAKLL